MSPTQKAHIKEIKAQMNLAKRLYKGITKGRIDPQKLFPCATKDSVLAFLNGRIWGLDIAERIIKGEEASLVSE